MEGRAGGLKDWRPDRQGGLRVAWLLESLPGIGAVRAERMMSALQIAPTRRIQGLGHRQRVARIAALRREGR